MRKHLHTILAGLLAVTGAIAITGLGTTLAPTAQAAPPTEPCGPLGSSGFVTTEVATGMSAPVSVTLDTNGDVLVGERGTGKINRFAPSGGGYVNTALPGSYNIPYGIAVDKTSGPTAGMVWVTNSAGNHLIRLAPDGSTYQQQPSSPSGIFVPGDVALDSTGTAYVASAVLGTISGVPRGHQILKLSPTAPWTTEVARDTTGDTWGVAVGPDDRVYNTEHPDKVVRSRRTPQGWSSTTIPSTGLSSPHGIDVDADATVYVADTGNDRVVAFVPASGSWTQVVLPIGGLSAPRDVAVDDGVVYVADTDNNRVLKATPVSVTAAADTASTTLGSAVTTNVRTNDSATGGTLADPTIAKHPKHGTATVNADGTITYAPNAGFSGTDSYTYAVRDSTGSVCATAKVTVTVTQGNACDPLGTTGDLTVLPIETGTDYPQYFDVAADGTLFVTDSENGEIVTMTPTATGYSRSVVATGVGNVTAIAIDDSDVSGALWVVRYPSEVLRLTPSGSTYTIANTYTGTLLVNLGGIDVAPDGDVFLSNTHSPALSGVVRLDKSAGYAAVPAMVGGLQFPHQVTVDDDGAVYATSHNRVVKLVDIGTGAGWSATDAVTGLDSAEGVAVDSTGTIWVGAADGLWRVAPSGPGYGPQERYALWGNNSATTVIIGEDDTPDDISDGTVYVSSFNDLWTFGPARLTTADDTATTTSPRPVTTDVRANDVANVRLGAPSVVSAPAHGTTTVNDDGTITYDPAAGFSGTDSYRYQVRDNASPARVCGIATVTVTVTSDTGCGLLPTSAYVSRTAHTIAGLDRPTGVTVDADGVAYLANERTGGSTGRILRWTAATGPVTIDATTGIDPQGIAVDAAGNVYYADEGEHEVVKLTKAGSTYTRSVLATNLQRPSGIAVDADGNVFFSENSSGHVHRLTPSGGGYTTSLVGSGLERPRGLAVDPAGNVFVADWADEDKIVRLSPSGATYTKSVVALGLGNPFGVAVDADGTLAVGDSGNDRVLRLVPNGTGYAQETLTVWGGNTPTWVATMASGDILVSDLDARQVVVLRKRTVSAQDDTATTTAQSAVTADVRANDAIFPANPAMSNPILTSTPIGGNATVGTDGRITYTPNAGFSGRDIVRYRVTDAADPASVCAAARLEVTVQNVFTPGNVSTPQNTPVTTPLSGLASTNGAPLATDHIWSMGSPQHGSIAIYDVPWDRPIRVDYLPDPGYSGPDSYTLNLCDQSEPQQCADVAVQVTVGVNTVAAVDDTASTDVATPVTTDVTGNDDSSSAQALAAPTVTSEPAHGSTSVGAGGITYTPDAGFSGVDAYTYEVCDTSTPTPVCDTATVAVTVRNLFTPGDDRVTPQNTPVTTDLADLVTTAGMPLDPTAVTSVTAPQHGGIAIDPATGAVTYTPSGGYTGGDFYIVRVCDTSAPVQCADLMMGITVGANTVTAVDDTATTEVGTAVTTDVVANDTSTSGQALAAPSATTLPSHGTVVLTAGRFEYTPEDGFSGEDSYSYEVCDTSSPTPVCDTADVTVTVRNSFTGGPAVSTPQNTPVTTDLADLAGTTGAALDPTAVTSATAPAHGGIAIDATTGAVTYTPAGGYTGDDAYTVRACDTSAPVQCADVTIAVTVGANSVTAADDTATTGVESAVTTDVLANDTTASGQALAVPTIATAPADGTTSVDTDGITYTPDAGFSGTDAYTYEVCDTSTPTPVCDTADVTVTVRNAFTPGSAITTPQNTPVTTDLADIATTTGKPLDPTTVTSVTAPGHGSIGIQPDGSVVYTPTAGYAGADAYTVNVCDTSTPVQCADVTIAVTVGANTVTATDDAATTDVATDVTTDVLANDTTASGQALAAPAVTGAATNGTTAVGTGGITYTPDAGFSGQDAYTYEVCDTSTPTPVCDAAIVTVTVRNAFTPGTGVSTGVSTGQDTPVRLDLDDLVTTTGKPLSPGGVTQVTAPEHGSIAIDPVTGAVTYTPAPGYVGAHAYTVQVCDTSVPAQCATVTVQVTVTAAATATAPTTPSLSVSAPSRALLHVTTKGQPKPLSLTAQVTMRGVQFRAQARKAPTGTATLYGPAGSPSAAMCSPTTAVASVPVATTNGTITTPAVPVTRTGYYTWVVTTGGDARNLPTTYGCANPGATTLVHRPQVGRLQVQTGYTGTAPGVRGRKVRPTKITVPAIGMRAKVKTVGIRRGSMMIPHDIRRGGWLADSAAPGELVGATVIAGHVSDRRDNPGAFGKLRNARKGQVIKVRSGGKTQRYRITRITTQPRAKGLDGAATSTTGAHRLTLVTCTGKVTYRNGRFHYTKNLVVTAVPIG